MKLLVADDHDLVREMLASYLESRDDVDVRLAATLDEAMAIIAADGPFDVVPLDYGMPGMNGLDGLRRALLASGGGRWR